MGRVQVVKHGGHFSHVMRNVASPLEWLQGAWGKALTVTGDGCAGILLLLSWFLVEVT